MPRPPRLLDQMRQVLRVRHYAQRTEACYVDWARRFIRFHGLRHPRDMGAAEVAQFLTHLAVERRVSASTQNQALNALVFLYAAVLEDGLGTAVNFFHLDCLASEVRLNVDLDTVMTVLANGCYRWLGRQLRGFEKAAPKQLYRRFVETAGTVVTEANRIVVQFDRRCHNPILREAALDRDQIPIPWWHGRPLAFSYL